MSTETETPTGQTPVQGVPSEAQPQEPQELPTPVAVDPPVEAVTRVFVVSKRYPLLVEGDFTEVLAKLEPKDADNSRRFGPVFRLVDRENGKRQPSETGLWAPNLNNISGVQPAEVPVEKSAYDPGYAQFED